MTVLLLSLALAHAGPLTVDLDGDGSPETVASLEGEVRVGDASVPCHSYEALCEIEVHDITSGDKARQLAVCALGVRDERTCDLYRYDGARLVAIEFPGETAPERLGTSGNGIVLGYSRGHRLYERTDKYLYRNGSLQKVAQPLYTPSEVVTIHVDRTFPIRLAPASSQIVGNVRPDSDVTLVGEHGETSGWLLLRLSSGITGWVQVDDLVTASDQYRAVMQAG